MARTLTYPESLAPCSSQLQPPQEIVKSGKDEADDTAPLDNDVGHGDGAGINAHFRAFARRPAKTAVGGRVGFQFNLDFERRTTRHQRIDQSRVLEPAHDALAA